MPAATVNLTGSDILEAGSTFRRVYTFVDEASDPIDLTDYDPQSTGSAGGAQAYFRLTADTTGSPLIELDSVTNINHEGCYILQPPTLGQVQILIDAATLETLSFDTDPGDDSPNSSQRAGVWDLEVSGVTQTPPVVTEVIRLAQGSWDVSTEVTRPQP